MGWGGQGCPHPGVWDYVYKGSGSVNVSAETSSKTQPEEAAQSWARTLLSLPAVGRAGPRVAPRGKSSRLTRVDSSA